MTQQAINFLIQSKDWIGAAVMASGIAWAFVATVKAQHRRTVEDYCEALIAVIWVILAVMLLKL